MASSKEGNQLSRISRTDCHAHFTGSLPACFLVQKSQYEDTWDQLLQTLMECLTDRESLRSPLNLKGTAKLQQDVALLEESLASSFSCGGRRGFDNFSTIYRAIQSALVPSTIGEESFAYHVAAYSAILAANARAGVAKVLLFSSFDENMELLQTKIRAALQACTQQNAVRLYLRLTLPRESDRVRRFAEGGGFSMLAPVLDAHPEYRRFITGLDFSGFESTDDWPITQELIRDAITFAKRYDIDVSVHIGEDLYYVSANELLGRFETLYRSGIRWLCHASYLWLPETLLQADPTSAHAAGYKKERLALRRTFGTSNALIDICPSISLATQIIERAEAIPVRELGQEGFRVRIGTDNPTFVRTTLRREYELLGKVLRQP
jgi:Adenosine deaminase